VIDERLVGFEIFETLELGQSLHGFVHISGDGFFIDKISLVSETLFDFYDDFGTIDARISLCST